MNNCMSAEICPGHPNTHIQEFIYIGEIEDIVPPGICTCTGIKRKPQRALSKSSRQFVSNQGEHIKQWRKPKITIKIKVCKSKSFMFFHILQGQIC